MDRVNYPFFPESSDELAYTFDQNDTISIGCDSLLSTYRETRFLIEDSKIHQIISMIMAPDAYYGFYIHNNHFVQNHFYYSEKKYI